MAKVMISLPDELRERLDREAQRRSITRSELVRIAVQRELGETSPEEIEAAIARLRDAFSGAGPGDAAEWIRWERDHGHSV
jgi:predicted transcriptional regulator